MRIKILQAFLKITRINILNLFKLILFFSIYILAGLILNILFHIPWWMIEYAYLIDTDLVALYIFFFSPYDLEDLIDAFREYLINNSYRFGGGRGGGE